MGIALGRKSSHNQRTKRTAKGDVRAHVQSGRRGDAPFYRSCQKAVWVCNPGSDDWPMGVWKGAVMPAARTPRLLSPALLSGVTPCGWVPFRSKSEAWSRNEAQNWVIRTLLLYCIRSISGNSTTETTFKKKKQ